jgi:hypothetical protein
MPDDDQPFSSYDTRDNRHDLVDIDRTHDIAFYSGFVEQRTRSAVELGCRTAPALFPLTQCVFGGHGSSSKETIAGMGMPEAMLPAARVRELQINWISRDIRSPLLLAQFILIVI